MLYVGGSVDAIDMVHHRSSYEECGISKSIELRQLLETVSDDDVGG